MKAAPASVAVLLAVSVCWSAGLYAGAASASSVGPQPFNFAGAGGGSFAVPVGNMRDARFLSTVAQEHDFSCGSAALATLLTYHYGLPTTEREAFERMYAKGDTEKIRREGFSLLDIKRFLEEEGYSSDGFEVTLDQMAEAGVPAIVLISEGGYHHFVVVKGIRDGRVLLGDPSRGTRLMPRAQFLAVWQQQLAFVIHSHDGRAGFNLVADWKRAPLAPMAMGVLHDGLAGVALPRHGPGDF